MTTHPLVAGIDIGSRSMELVLLQDGQVVHWDLLPTTFDPLGQCRSLLDRVRAARIVATGYGRKLLLENLDHPEITAITEIQAYALGVRYLCPGVRTVLDIGGQDTKAIALSEAGKVVKFAMNDRCAAGTGKFLEFMAVALQVPLEQFGDFALKADRRIQISSMCTVFVESEATSLMARGETPANIAMGLHLAIVSRTVAMLHRVGVVEPLLFAGGGGSQPLCPRPLGGTSGDDRGGPGPAGLGERLGSSPARRRAPRGGGFPPPARSPARSMRGEPGDGEEKMGGITPKMTILEILSQQRQTEPVFRRYDAAAGVCLCCQALFDSLEELAQKYGLDLNRLLDDLNAAADNSPDKLHPLKNSS